MKRLFILFLLLVSLSALYLYVVSCKEGIRSKPINIKKMAMNAQKQYKLNQKTKQRIAKKE